MFRKSNSFQFRDCIYTAVSKDPKFTTQYRRFTNLVRNLHNILATIKPTKYNTLAL